MSTQVTLRHEIPTTPANFVEKIHWSEHYQETIHKILGMRYQLIERNPETGVREVKTWPSTDVPAVVRKRNVTVEALANSGVDRYDIPAFLRKQAD